MVLEFCIFHQNLVLLMPKDICPFLHQDNNLSDNCLVLRWSKGFYLLCADKHVSCSTSYLALCFVTYRVQTLFAYITHNGLDIWGPKMQITYPKVILEWLYNWLVLGCGHHFQALLSHKWAEHFKLNCGVSHCQSTLSSWYGNHVWTAGKSTRHCAHEACTVCTLVHSRQNWFL